jgi:TetR/AcrR family transcriptional repressor of mexJK operon
MSSRQNKRALQTREQLRAAAQRLFLRDGFAATSTDAILAEAGVASKETFYRHYTSKEALFVDVLGQLTLEQPDVVARLAQLPAPHDIASLRSALITIARELLSLMSQPAYQSLLRVVLAETPRFPKLGPLYRAAVPERGFAIVRSLLEQAHERNLIAASDFDAVVHAFVGGLLAYALTSLAFGGEAARPPAIERADAVAELIVRALAPDAALTSGNRE